MLRYSQALLSWLSVTSVSHGKPTHLLSKETNTITTLSDRSLAHLDSMGENCRHGGHHPAEKYTPTIWIARSDQRERRTVSA